MKREVFIMEVKTVNLYEHYNIPANGATGGFLTVYSRAQSKEVKAKSRPAVLVIPGGGYGFVSEREGEPVALAFVGKGYCAFVLDYTVNAAYPVPLIEACMAICYIRENAESYGIDTTKVAAIGFSAGGHLTGMLATMYGEREVRQALGKRAQFVRPDAAVFSYPVVTTEDGYTHENTRRVISADGTLPYEKLSIEKRVTADSVPAFIWHTMEDDCVPVENSFFLASAYRKAGVPFALHIFEKGGHGLSLCNGEVCDNEEAVSRLGRVDKWIELAFDWLELRGFKVRVKDMI